MVWQPSGKARDRNSLTDGSTPPQTSIKKGKCMVKIIFEYRDTYSNWQWRRQQCIMSSVEECIKVYGLGVDCDYRIISVEPVERQHMKTTTKYIGLSFSEALLLIFIVLKLCHIINWSWWWVLAPLWIPILLVVVICIIYAFKG